VGHADYDFADAQFLRALHQKIHGGDCGFGAFEAEAFLAAVIGVKEMLEDFCLGDLKQGAAALIAR